MAWDSVQRVAPLKDAERGPDSVECSPGLRQHAMCFMDYSSLPEPASFICGCPCHDPEIDPEHRALFDALIDSVDGEYAEVNYGSDGTLVAVTIVSSQGDEIATYDAVQIDSRIREVIPMLAIFRKDGPRAVTYGLVKDVTWDVLSDGPIGSISKITYDEYGPTRTVSISSIEGKTSVHEVRSAGKGWIVDHHEYSGHNRISAQTDANQTRLLAALNDWASGLA